MLNRVWKFLAKEGTTTDGCVPYVSGTGTVPSKCQSQCTDREEFKLYKCEKGSEVEALNKD